MSGSIGWRQIGVGVVALLAMAAAVALLTGGTLEYGDGTADGKKSIGGGGHLIMFDAGGDGMWLNRIELFGSRYGTSTPPDEDFDVYVVDADHKVIRKICLPYVLWQRGPEYWRELPNPPIQVPKEFGIGLVFHAGRTKGVYVAYEKAEAGHSYSWTPGAEARLMDDADWMVRVEIDDAPLGDPQAQDLVVLKSGEAFFDSFLGAAGEPISVDTKAHAQLAPEDIASIRFGAVSSAGAAPATVLLLSGIKVPGTILAADEDSVTIRDMAGRERQIGRDEIARLEFN